MPISPWRRFPAEPEAWFSSEEIDRSQRYQGPIRQWTIVSGGVRAALTLALIGFGVPPAILDGVGGPWPVRLAVMALLLGVYDVVTSLPLDAWRQLRYDREWGFSTTTTRTFVLDQFRAIAVTLGLLSALLIPLWAVIRTTERWWIWVWAVLVGFSVLLAFLLPAVILPIFNKFTPLDDDALRDRLLAVAAKCGADISEIEIEDASKRTRRDNAFVAGLGRTRKVVLFDTMLERPHEQIVSITAHEIGHWKLRHILRVLPVGAGVQLVDLAVLQALLTTSTVLDFAGVDSIGDPAAVPVFLLGFGVVGRFSRLVTAYLSRSHERQADLYALEITGDAKTFIAAMRDLHTDNLAELTPSAWKRLNHTHPPAAERMAMGAAWGAAADASA
ncbi:MAG: M48 family metallopeptidase [Acidimicrobiales bacterium]